MAFTATGFLRQQAQRLRRLPLPEAIEAVRTGKGSTVLPSAVKSVTLRYIQRMGPPGPVAFTKTIAPRLAYANPSVQFNFERIPDVRSKSKDPDSPDKGATWPNNKMPRPELKIKMEGRDEQRIELSEKVRDEEIYQKILEATGADGSPATFEPLPTETRGAA